ncbi:hypothetical protein SB861_55600, partial [Paraburkholderia sp. SIMBA_049]
AFAGLVEMPFFVGGLWFGIHHFGLIGAAVVVAARALVDYGVLLYLSAIRMRAILLDMLAHLAFLLASLFLAQAWSGLGESIGLCAVVLLLNLAWSLTMTPGLRALVREAGMQPDNLCALLAQRMTQAVGHRPRGRLGHAVAG